MPNKSAYRTSQPSRRSSNQSAFSTGGIDNDSSSFRASSSFQTRREPLFGGDSDDLLFTTSNDANRRSLGASSSESYHQYHPSQNYNHNHNQQNNPSVLVHGTSSLSSLPSMDEYRLDDGEQSYELQLFAYRCIYVLQGAFIGLLGPALQYFSQVAHSTSGLTSPVASFGPIFAAHGGAALLMGFVSELVLTVAIEMRLIKYLMVGLLLASAGWYACLVPVAAASGNLGVSIYFIAKGVWCALLNISLNRCVLWVAGEKVERGRSLVTSLNFAYGFGTVLGPATALLLHALDVELRVAFYGLAAFTLVPIAIVLATPSPRPLHGRDEHQTLLGFEDPTRRVPTVPSPIVGGVFLHVKHYAGSANYNPDTYDPQTNLIILMVTIFATLLFGIQLGLGAFLFDFLGHVLTVASSTAAHPLTDAQIYVWGLTLLLLFWAALWLSYAFFSTYMFHALNLFSIFHLSLACALSAFGILVTGAESATNATNATNGANATTSLATFTVCLVVLGFALAPLFTLSIHCLTRVINELLIRRVSSLIVFGAGMGEIFIPVLMGFFMSSQSGQRFGSVAVSYMLFILSLALVGVSGALLLMVRAKLLEHAVQTGGGTAYVVATGIAAGAGASLMAARGTSGGTGTGGTKKKKKSGSSSSATYGNRL